MKKFSNELKVGVTALITIIIFIWLYNFLKGKDYFSKTARYYVIYDKIGGLAESSPVEVNGYKVGVVQSIRFTDPLSGRLLVVLTVDKGIKLPRNTIAEITTATLVAGMKVQFIYGEGPGTYSNGDTIPGRLAESIILKLENELIPLKDKVVNLIVSLDSVATSLDEILDPQFRNNIRTSVASLSSTSENLNEIVASREEAIKETLTSINEFTRMLADNSSKLSNTISNLESLSDTINAADLYETASNLRKSLEKASIMVEDLGQGKGTAGKLMTDDSLYVNLNNALASLDLLLKDLKENPKRYVHFSIFGKKNTPSGK
ncbi:MAG: MCE family protein [Bacteroidales bacterium]|nr:MCE family protein [Bacteroidales bacterium]